MKTIDIEDESPYCDVCGTCGYIGCCGIRNFISEHIQGKTNCKNEDLIISELIDLCDYKDKVFEENDKLKQQLKEKDKEIERLNNIKDETLKELEKIGDFYTTPAGEVIHLKDKIYHINKAMNKLKEGKE